MEEIVTELKLRVKYLESQVKERDERELIALRDFDKTMATMMVDISSYKNKIATIEKEVKGLFESGRISHDEYIKFLEYMNH